MVMGLWLAAVAPRFKEDHKAHVTSPLVLTKPQEIGLLTTMVKYTGQSQGLLSLQPGWHQGLACLISTASSWVVEHVLSMYEALALMPPTHTHTHKAYSKETLSLWTEMAAHGSAMVLSPGA